VPEWLTIVLTSAGLFVLLVLASPLWGRKPMSAMTQFDHLTGLVLALMVALTALGVVDQLSYGFLGLLVWAISIMAVQYLIQKSKWAHDHIYGKEMVIIKNGKIMEENLHSSKMTAEELLSQLRRKDIFHVADVEFAVMEANGDITAMLKRQKQPLTPQDMRLNVSQTKEPQTVILDGNIMDEPLSTMGLNREWLFTELKKVGVNPENVFVAQVDAMGELYLDLYDDAIQLPQPKAKALLLATLKRVEADLSSFALETKDKTWRKKYSRFSKQIRSITEKLEPHLTT
jgi:uncharacterized membrane protein YcaP (DUF421 family)